LTDDEVLMTKDTEQ